MISDAIVFDLLNGIAAASLALAALASLLTLFRSSDQFNKTDKVDFKGIILICLTTSIGSYIPMILSMIMNAETIWMVSSILYIAIGFSLFMRLRYEISEGLFVPVPSLRQISFFLQVSSVIVIALLSTNIFFQNAALYASGMLWGFGLAAIRLYLFLDVVIMKNNLFSFDGLREKFNGKISSLTSNDENLLLENLNVQTCYSNAWLYLIRASRLEEGIKGYKYIGTDLRFAFGYRNSTIYITHLPRETNTHSLVDFCEQSTDVHSGLIILKKVDNVLGKKLIASGHFAKVEPTKSEIYEDERYPEHYIDLSKMFNDKQTNLTKNFLNKVRNFESNNEGSVKLKTDFYGFSLRIDEWLDHLWKLSKENKSKYRTYKPMIEEIIEIKDVTQELFITGVFVDSKNYIHGIYLSEKLSDQVAGLYCALSSSAKPGITEWMDYHFFRYIFEHGYGHLYLGGSETQGVHKYVQKLSPLTPKYEMYPLKFVTKAKQIR